MRILVVDDDEDIREMHTAVLNSGGFHIDAAADGQAAWAALTNNSDVLLITDSKMPDMSGLESVEKLRSARNTVPVILAASRLETNDLDRCPALRLADTLCKPYPLTELLETVKKLIRPEEPRAINESAFALRTSLR